MPIDEVCASYYGYSEELAAYFLNMSNGVLLQSLTACQNGIEVALAVASPTVASWCFKLT